MSEICYQDILREKAAELAGSCHKMDFLDSSDGVLRNFVTAFSGKS